MKHFDDYSGTQNTWQSFRCSHPLKFAGYMGPLVRRVSELNPMDIIKSLYYSRRGADHVFVMVGDSYRQTAILQGREDLNARQISEN